MALFHSIAVDGLNKIGQAAEADDVELRAVLAAVHMRSGPSAANNDRAGAGRRRAATEGGAGGPEATTSVSTEPITGLCIVYGSEAPPEGFEKITRDLNRGSGNRSVYLCLRRERGARPITNISIVHVARGEFVPPGFVVARRTLGNNAPEFNVGPTALEVFVCYSLAPGAPITEVKVVYPSDTEHVVHGYTLVDRSPLGFSGNLNLGTRGKDVFISYCKPLWHVTELVGPSLTSQLPYTRAVPHMGSLTQQQESSFRSYAGLLNPDVVKRKTAAATRAIAAAVMASPTPVSVAHDPPAPAGPASAPGVSGGAAAGEARPRRLSVLGFDLGDIGPTQTFNTPRPDSPDNASDTPADGAKLGTDATDAPDAAGGAAPHDATSSDEASPNTPAGSSLQVVPPTTAPVEQAPLSTTSTQPAPSPTNSVATQSLPRVDSHGSIGPHALASASLPGSMASMGQETGPLVQDRMMPVNPPRTVARIIAPMLVGLYSRYPPTVQACLESLEELVSSGFLMSDLNLVRELCGVADDQAVSEEHIATTNDRLWQLLDFIVYCVADAVALKRDDLHKEVSSFFLTVVHVPAPGLHPDTLYRIVEFSLASHVFFCQKHLHQDRRLQAAQLNSVPTEIEHAELCMSDSKKQTRAMRTMLTTLVQTVLGEVASANVSGPKTPFATIRTARSSQTLAAAIVDETVDFVCLSSNIGRCFSRYERRRTVSNALCSEMHAWGSLLFGRFARAQAVVSEAAASATGETSAETAVMIANGLFGEEATPFTFADRNRTVDAFVLLSLLCKLASSILVCRSDNGLPVRSADYHVKIMALQMLATFVENSAEKFAGDNALVLSVRRFVCPAVLVNLSGDGAGLTVVFRSTVAVIPRLWTHYRQHLKLELGLLVDILLRVLRSPNSSMEQKIDVITVLDAWFQSQSLVDLYLNFDNDAAVAHMRVFDKLFSTLCGLAMPTEPNPVLDLTQAAATALDKMVKSLLDASATAYLMPRDARTRRLSVSGWAQSESSGSMLNLLSAVREDQSDGKSAEQVLAHTDQQALAARRRHEQTAANREVLDRGLKLAEKSLNKCIKYLIAAGYIPNTPDEVVSFIRRQITDEEAIGDYIGSDGDTPEDKLFHANVRYAFLRGLPFASESLDSALRTLLTRGGFRLAGEGQKVGRIAESFAKVYHAQNPDAFSCSDSVELLSYALIMLNTDAHNPAIAPSKKMTQEQFIRNLRGGDNGKDFPLPMLQSFYRNITTNEIKMPLAHLIGKSRTTVPLPPAKLFLQELSSHVQRAQVLIREESALRRSYYSRCSVDLVKLMVEDTWADLYQLVRAQVDSGDNVLIEKALSLMKCMISSVLFCGLQDERRAFCTLLAEVAFKANTDTTLLLHKFHMPAPSTVTKVKAAIQNGAHMEQPWVQKVLEAKPSTNLSRDDISDAVAEVHQTVQHILEQLTTSGAQQEVLDLAERFTAPTSKMLKEDTSRRLLLEGVLIKACKGGHGKRVKYTFFLFSDILLYASMTWGRYSTHQQIALDDIFSVDIDPPELGGQRYGFVINAAAKPVFILAPSEVDRVAWKRNIEEAKRARAAARAAVAAMNAASHSAAESKGNERHSGKSRASGGSGGGSGGGEGHESDDDDAQSYDSDTPMAYGIGGDSSSAASTPVASTSATPSAVTEPRAGRTGSTASDDGSASPASEAGTDASKRPRVKSKGGDTPRPSASYGPAASGGSSLPAATVSVGSGSTASVVVTAVPMPASTVKPNVFDVTAGKTPEEIEFDFKMGLRFTSPLLAKPAGETPFTDEQKLRLYGLFKQARCGDCPPDSGPSDASVAGFKQEAWRQCAGMTKMEAMTDFLQVLQILVPRWRETVMPAGAPPPPVAAAPATVAAAVAEPAPTPAPAPAPAPAPTSTPAPAAEPEATANSHHETARAPPVPPLHTLHRVRDAPQPPALPTPPHGPAPPPMSPLGVPPPLPDYPPSPERKPLAVAQHASAGEEATEHVTE